RRGAGPPPVPAGDVQAAVVAPADGEVPAMTATAPSLDTAAIIAELRRALEALDAVIQLRLEERQGGVLQRPLAIDAEDEAIPSLDRYEGCGPLAATIAMTG